MNYLKVIGIQSNEGYWIWINKNFKIILLKDILVLLNEAAVVFYYLRFLSC